MKSLFTTLLLVAASLAAYSQCNTTLNKLLPDKSVNNDDEFGNSLASTAQFLVIGQRSSDTLGIYYGGAAYVYEKTAAGWAYRAMLTPSDPDEFGFFGTAIDIDPTGNTIVIVDEDLPHNRIYIFEKPASGWKTMTETVKIESPGYADLNISVNISDDASDIVVSNPWVGEPRFYVFHKPATGWTSSITPDVFMGPDFGSNQNLFGIDILLKGNYIYVASGNDPTGEGIYVYKKNGATYSYQAKLSITVSEGLAGYFGRTIDATDDMVATTAAVYDPDDGGVKIMIFKKNVEWQDATETVTFELPDDENARSIYFPFQFISSTEIAASALYVDGEWNTGRVYVSKTMNGNWDDVNTEVIYEEHGLSSRSGFAHDMTWSGSGLVRSTSLVPTGLADRDAVVSLSRSGGLWGSKQFITVSRKNSANFLFGTSVHKRDQTLFVGAPYDGSAGEEAGAVYLYEKTSGGFAAIQTILPAPRPLRPNGTRDSGFGYSVYSFGDELAIGAPSYSTGERLGKIFLYKRNGFSWVNPTLYDSITPPADLMLDHFGAQIALDDNFLFASAYNNFNDEHTNAVVIFKKKSGKWIYQQTLKIGKPLDKSWPSIRFSLLQDQLLVGAYFTIGGGTFMYEKNATTTQWELSFGLGADVFSSVGADVKLQENHFFVGVPSYPYNGILNAGAVLVYAKLPDAEWDSQMQPVAVIGARTPVKGGNFGASLDAVGNTLAVGAPGSVLNEDNEIRTVPGNTYIIQSQRYYWDHTTEFLNLQGDRHNAEERDHFGADIGLDEEYFYIGAKNENTEAGPFSGAAYYVPTPPVVFLVPPLCLSSDLVQLKGYPFDGVWSGPGVTSSGLFNASVAAEGVHELSYTTPNCAFIGTIQLEVIKGPDVTRISPGEVALCSENGVELALSQVEDATYAWYFKPFGNDQFSSIGKGSATKVVMNPGEYFARVSGAHCTSASPMFKVIIEQMDVVLGPQPVVCSHDETLALKASIDGGQWEGNGVQAGGKTFFSRALPNGKYPLTFRFTSPKGCMIAMKDTVRIRVIEPITLQRSPDDYCETGAATVKANTNDPSLTFTWYYSLGGEAFSKIEKVLSDEAEVFESGSYYALATNGDCAANSEAIDVGLDADLNIEVTPAEKEIVFCAVDDNSIEVEARDETIFSWYYKPVDGDSFELIGSGTESTITVSESGYYRMHAEYGFCSYEGEPISINLKADSLWVPNFFSPNGKGYNETFEVLTNSDNYSLNIFNRYGDAIYSAPNSNWDGGSVPSGVYYWQVSYQGCGDRAKTAKGWVQLMR